MEDSMENALNFFWKKILMRGPVNRLLTLSHEAEDKIKLPGNIEVQCAKNDKSQMMLTF